MKSLLIICMAVIAFASNLFAADPPATQPAITSKPVDKDGLRLSVTLAQKQFTTDEPISFKAHFKNVSDKTFSLFNVTHFWNWDVSLTDLKAAGPWQMHETFIGLRSPEPTVHKLQPGDTFDVPVVIDPKLFEFIWKGNQSRPVAPVRQLRPGNYRLLVKISLEQNPVAREIAFADWTGTITTEPLEFEVIDKPAARPATP